MSLLRLRHARHPSYDDGDRGSGVRKERIHS